MTIISLNFIDDAPYIPVKIGVSNVFKQELKKSGKKIVRAKKSLALIDTGATHTCIDPVITKYLGIKPTSRISVVTPSTGDSTYYCNGFDVSVTMDGENGSFKIDLTNVVEAPIRRSRNRICVLIGRDILSNSMMVYNGILGKGELVMNRKRIPR